ncbi:hypothetical protein RO3G_16330 [Rhizopus delemar RA 99-880]|uniref:Uncharacterized protein n=1 Tax=Rhizopus delemar (strain RA 99-880 / ATCC MYA-4621 / FGSC 9543 / NRRL 43880) TaxID=246409 RepID=I1CT39_RHIO9|nr:hypothetical protein RO3G_16330 [Rhizopus delemar RA 99-880]|eukprot:EIE91619.1 hypothetical protein RO3G_16330 [Rhizopus delemar RA 99-880]
MKFLVILASLSFIGFTQAVDKLSCPCHEKHSVESGNNCQSIASNHNISKDKSPLWNQKFGFQLDYANAEKDDALRTANSNPLSLSFPISKYTSSHVKRAKSQSVSSRATDNNRRASTGKKKVIKSKIRDLPKKPLPTKKFSRSQPIAYRKRNAFPPRKYRRYKKKPSYLKNYHPSWWCVFKKN